MLLKAQNQILLPSQETLLQRLYHAACYNDQLTLIAGGKGAGKTTLATALVTELEDYNAALVTCPLHADNAEIRRKILVQLLTDPLFDDEVPLADTLIRLTQTLTRPIHIVIDDAHFLSQELWAELMILSKLKCADKLITITMTVTPEHMAFQMGQLSSNMKEMILPISIETLDLVEREALYQTLLSRSEQAPFTPREIVKQQLAKQSGTPQEVASLLELALYGEPDKAKKSYLKHLIFGAIAFLTLITVAAAFYFIDQTKPVSGGRAVIALPLTHAQSVGNYGQKLLEDYFHHRNKAYKAALMREKQQAELAIIKQQKAKSVDAALSHQLKDALEVANVQTGEIQSEPKPVEVQSKEPKSETTQSNVSESNKVKPKPKPDTSKSKIAFKYHIYTLQVANLTTKKSLDSVLQQLKRFNDVFVMKKDKRFIVLQGNFKSEVNARKAAKKLEQETNLSEPWLRQWQQVKQYQLLKHYRDGEIRQ